MNINSIGNTEIFVKQLASVVNGTLSDKNEKVSRFSQRIAEKIASLGSGVPDTLSAKCSALVQATSDPQSIDAPVVSGIAQEILGILGELKARMSEKAAPEVKKTVYDPYLRRPDVVKILDANPPAALSSVEALPKLQQQAKKLAMRIIDGVYGDEVRERFCNGLIPTEDLFFLLLADAVFHRDGLDTIELFKNRLKKRDLLKLKCLKWVLSPEKIAAVITGKIAKDALLGGVRLTKAVAATYLGDHATALTAYMNSFYRPTLNQLLHIALESSDLNVRGSLQQAVRENDPKTWEKLEQLLAIFDEKDDKNACKMAHDLRFDPAFCHLLSVMASGRPEYVLSMAESFFNSTEEEVKKVDPDMIDQLMSGYMDAVKKSILEAASHGDVRHVQELFGLLQGVSTRNIARGAFVEAFCKTNPKDTLDMILSCYKDEDAPCTISATVAPGDLFDEFIEDKTSDDVLAFLPHVQAHSRASIDLLSALLIRAAKHDMNTVLELLKHILEVTTKQSVIVGALKALGDYLGSIASDTSHVQQILKRLTPAYGDIVREHFIMGVQNEGTKLCAEDVFVILNGVSDQTLFSELATRVFVMMGVSLTLSQKANVDALLEKLSDKRKKDLVLIAIAQAYASTGQEPEIREGFEVLRQIRGRGALNEALVWMVKAVFKSPLDIASKERYGRKMLASARDTQTQDAIRVSLVSLLSRSPDVAQALDIVKDIRSDECLAIALSEFAIALLELRPDGYQDLFKRLLAIAEARETLACFQAVLHPVISVDRILARELVEYARDHLKIALDVNLEGDPESE